MHDPPAPVVVGAGPAGLAVARALARRGVAATVLERDRVAASWAHHDDHLKLHTRKGDAFAGSLRHAAAYTGPEGDAGRRVLVVGAGNTGVDLALALADAAASVDLAVRDGLALVPCPTPLSQHAGTLLQALPPALAEVALRRVRRAYPELGLPWPSGPLRDAFPVVGHRLVDAVRAGRVRVRPGVVGFTVDGARFADGAEAPYDAVWLATGYRAATAGAAPWLPPDPERRDGVKIVAGVRGLHPLGFAYPSFTSWLQALPRAAARSARAVAADLDASGR